MCIGKKPKAPKPIKPPPPPQAPQPQVSVQDAVQAEQTDKRRNKRQGMGAPAQPVESMLTGNSGVTKDQIKPKLGGVSMLGGG